MAVTTCAFACIAVVGALGLLVTQDRARPVITTTIGGPGCRLEVPPGLPSVTVDAPRRVLLGDTVTG